MTNAPASSLILLYLCLVASSSIAAIAVKIAASDERVLLALKKDWGPKFNGAYGHEFASTSWVAGADCSTWDWVYCDSKTGKVTGIIFGEDGLGINRKGPLHPIIGNLTALAYLKLNSGGFTGPIPASLGNRKIWSRLDLHSNKFSGPIPDWLTKQPALVTLRLNDNRLTGPIPNFSASKKIETISLSGNKLTGQIPDFFAQLRSLGEFSVSENLLSGIVPTSVSKLKKLNYFSVSNNSFSGLLPQFPKVAAPADFVVSLEYNYFTGSPFVNIGGKSLCPAAVPAQIYTSGNCLTPDPKCKPGTPKKASVCKAFCAQHKSPGCIKA